MVRAVVLVAAVVAGLLALMAAIDGPTPEVDRLLLLAATLLLFPSMTVAILWQDIWRTVVTPLVVILALHPTDVAEAPPMALNGWRVQEEVEVEVDEEEMETMAGSSGAWPLEFIGLCGRLLFVSPLRFPLTAFRILGGGLSGYKLTALLLSRTNC